MSDKEKTAYCNYFNGELRGDPELKSVLPINANSDEFYKALGQGLLLSRFIAKRFPSVSVEPTPSSVIAAAKQVGVGVNITEEELTDAAHNPEIAMEFVWQLIKTYLTQIEPHDDMKRLLEGSESLHSLVANPEKLFLRWFNFHLNNHGHHRTVGNFSADVNDAENYAVLLAEIAKDSVGEEDLVEAFKQKDPLKRAEMILRWAARIGCRKFVTPQDITAGVPNLNFAFVATLFKRYPALGPTSDEKLNDLTNRIEDAESLLAESILDKEDLQSQIDQTMADFDSLTAELGDMEIELEGLCAEVDALTDEKLSMEDLLGELNGENEELENELLALTQETEDLFAEMEKEGAAKIDLETLLRETEEEFNNTKAQTTAKISDLQAQLQAEIDLKNDYSTRLDNTLKELEQTQAEAKTLEESLNLKLSTHRSEREEVAKQVEAAQKELEETLRLAEEAETTKDDLFKLLNETMAELETAKTDAQTSEDELRATLAEEKAKKENAYQALQDKIAEYEAALAKWQEERAGLLKRIEELEQELEDLKEEMREKLEQAQREMERALAEALENRNRALSDAENEKDQALDKVRMLLSGNAKEGYLYVYESSLVMGMHWKKKYFTLRDNLFCWFSNDKVASSNQKPKGVIYCEESRVYEMNSDEAPGKREYAFLIDTGKNKINIAAESLEDMKSWMTELRIAKKKKLGVKVVSEAGDKK